MDNNGFCLLGVGNKGFERDLEIQPRKHTGPSGLFLISAINIALPRELDTVVTVSRAFPVSVSIIDNIEDNIINCVF